MQIPITIETPHFLMDHQFQGHPVLPAVEAMAILADAFNVQYPHLKINQLANARFDKFSYLDRDKPQLDAIVELTDIGDGHCRAALMTKIKAPKSKITRTRIHAQMSLLLEDFGQPKNYPYDVISVPEGICEKISPKSIYQDLVPFGPAFQNIVDSLYISMDGALAKIMTPAAQAHTHRGRFLGSGYALDAAFHAACIWSQHYHGVIAFPVAIDRRWIFKPIRSDQLYFARIFNRNVSDDDFIFDIRILNENGELCEAADGVYMRDVSGGRLKPPPWILASKEPDPLIQLKRNCQALTLVELAAIAPFAPLALNQAEKDRWVKMTLVRKQSYLAARLALKRLWRRCNQENRTIDAEQIETISPHSGLPACRQTESRLPLYCSVSHDKRFAVAAGDHVAVGVDVETISAKALKAGRIFMHAEEQALVHQSAESPLQASMRIWTIKEAVAKAMNRDLADIWHHLRVVQVTDKQSWVLLNDEQRPVFHARPNGHLMSLFLNISK